VPASPRPPAIVLEDLKAHTKAYQSSSTPRGSFVPPPDEVVVAVEMARAAERHRRTPSRPSPSLNSAQAPPTGAAAAGSGKGSTSGSYPPRPPVGTSDRSNGYSMGSSLPSGVSWRYVDVLNQDDRSTASNK
jgi:hypothetical protein